jgi:hypothetical protein
LINWHAASADQGAQEANNATVTTATPSFETRNMTRPPTTEISGQACAGMVN